MGGFRRGTRAKLFPFLWNVVGRQGQLYGNRKYDNKIDNANQFWFSYPGYNEIFTGYPDTAVNSNDKIYNKNESVLEFINKQKSHQGKVAAFTTWDACSHWPGHKSVRGDKNTGSIVSGPDCTDNCATAWF